MQITDNNTLTPELKMHFLDQTVKLKPYIEELKSTVAYFKDKAGIESNSEEFTSEYSTSENASYRSSSEERPAKRVKN